MNLNKYQKNFEIFQAEYFVDFSYASCELRVTSYKLHLEPRVTSYFLRVTSYELHFNKIKSRVASCELHFNTQNSRVAN